jgi:hypothetical protein
MNKVVKMVIILLLMVLPISSSSLPNIVLAHPSVDDHLTIHHKICAKLCDEFCKKWIHHPNPREYMHCVADCMKECVSRLSPGSQT